MSKDFKKLKIAFADDAETLRALELEEILENLPKTINETVKKEIAQTEFKDGEDGTQGEKGDKGDKGDTGEQGLPGEKGDTGANGKDGKDGEKGENGSPDTPEEIAEKINTLEQKIEFKVIKGFPSILDVVEEIKKKKLLELRDIKGARLDMNDQRWHGGGISNVTGFIQAGTNVTITGSGTLVSPYVINSTGGGGSQTPWLQNINGAGYELTAVGNLEVDGELGSMTPPTSLSVAYSYASLLPPENIVGGYTLGSGDWSYDSQDYPTDSPDMFFTVYAYTDIDDFSTYSSTSYVFNFPSPAPTPAIKEVTTVTTNADVAGNLNNTSFLIYPANDPDSSYVWYNVDGTGADPATGTNPIEVAISSGDSANAVATATRLALNSSGFVATGATNQVIITNSVAGATEDAADVNTGFSIVINTQGADEDSIVIFTPDLTWDAVSGAAGYRVVWGISSPINESTYIYETATASISMPSIGSEDLGVTIYPDIRPISDGVSKTYKLYHQITTHNEVFYSDTYSSIVVQDNNSGYQLNSEIISWTNTVTGANVMVQRSSDNYSYSTNSVATSSDVLLGQFSNVDLSNNQFYVNELMIASNNIEIDGTADTIKFWGDFQTEKFHGVGGVSSGAQSFAWLGIASGDYSFVSGIAAEAAGDYSVVFGIQAEVFSTGTYGIAIGDNARVECVGGISIGGSVNVFGDGYRAVSIGSNNSTECPTGEQGGFSFGTGLVSNSVSCVNIGAANTINVGANNSGVFGTLITQNGNGAFSIGYNYTNNNDYAITFGNLAVDAIIVNSNFGVGTQDPLTRLHVIDTVEQVRIGYDDSNYYKTTVSSTGGVTFDAVGSGAGFTFSDSVIMGARMLEKQGADVSSANNLVLGTDGNTFEITGTTQINLISNLSWQNGAKITLLFTSNPTVKHNQTTSTTNIKILLAGAADFVASAGDTLSLVLSEIGGTQAWREIGRAVI